MDVLDTLDALERYVLQSPLIPFTQLCVLDREQMDRLLQATRQELERMQREQPSVPSPDELLSQAANESKLIVESARQEANELLRDDRIKILSRQTFDEIVGAGKQKGNQLIQEAYAYSTERLSEIDRQLSKLNEQVSVGVTLAQKTAKDAEKARQQREKAYSRTQAKKRRQKIWQQLFG